MNGLWRTILRNRQLASVRVHRKPAPPAPVAAPQTARLAPVGIVAAPALPVAPLVTKPYIHIVFKRDTAEPWMTAFESVIPTDWLADRGFGAMEYFDVRVGVVQAAN